MSPAISQIKYADRKSYLKRQEKEKVLCIYTSRRKTGNSAQQLRRTVSSEKSHMKYYSNHLCVRHLGTMSMHFTDTEPEPAPSEWVGTSATDRSGLWTSSESSLEFLFKLSRPFSLHISYITNSNPCPIHAASSLHMGSSWEKYFISGHQVLKSHSYLSSVQEGEAEHHELNYFPKIKGCYFKCETCGTLTKHRKSDSFQDWHQGRSIFLQRNNFSLAVSIQRMSNAVIPCSGKQQKEHTKDANNRPFHLKYHLLQ